MEGSFFTTFASNWDWQAMNYVGYYQKPQKEKKNY